MNTILALTYSFMLGFMPFDEFTSTRGTVDMYNATHVSYELGMDIFECVHLFTGEETWQTAESSINWCPYRQKYFLGAEYHKEFNEALNLKIGIRHDCAHPIAPWNKSYISSDMSATEMYVKIEGRFDLWRRK